MKLHENNKQEQVEYPYTLYSIVVKSGQIWSNLKNFRDSCEVFGFVLVLVTVQIFGQVWRF